MGRSASGNPKGRGAIRGFPCRFSARCSGIALFVLVAVSGLAQTACAPPVEPAAPIRVGLLLDGNDSTASATQGAARLVVSEVDSRGGIEVGGQLRELVLLVRHVRGSPGKAAEAALELINRHGVVAIIGPSFSRNAIPAGGVAQQAGVPLISPSSTHPETTAGRPFVFRTTFVDQFQGQVVAELARRDLEVAEAAILYNAADHHSRLVSEVFHRTFERHGGKIVAVETFLSGDRDFGDQLERIAAARPGALFLPNFTREVVEQGRQARRLGIEAILLGTDAWAAKDLEHHDALDGSYFVQAWHYDQAPGDRRGAEFRDRFRSFLGHDPDETEALVYDSFGVLFAAMEGAPELEPVLIRDALAEIEAYPGVTGPITFRGQGGDPSKPIVVVRLHQGRITPYRRVFPEMRSQ